MSRLRLSVWASVVQKKSFESPKPKSFMSPSAKTANPSRSNRETSCLRYRCDELHLPGVSRASGQHHIPERDVDECRAWLSANAASHHQRAEAGIHGGGF